MSLSIRFEPTAVSPGLLHVTSLRGEEAIGRPYRFELDLVSADPSLPLDAMLGRPAVLSLGTRRIHGVVAELTQGDPGEGGYLYHAVLVPRMWLASLGVRSRVFQRMSAPQIAAAVLGEVGAETEARLGRQYTESRHAVQYQETGLDFVSRLLAAEGIHYHFEQGPLGERLIFGDGNEAFAELAGARYSREPSSADGIHIESWRNKKRLTPRAVLLHDGDGADPELPVEGQATVTEDGVGLHVELGGALGTPERATALAQQVAEALRADRDRYLGRSREPVGAGLRLDLSGCFRGDLDRRYLVVAVRHTARGAEYTAQIEAIADETVYRTRPAPKPRIDGLVQAVVEEAADRQGAASDKPSRADGQYRVRMPFDLEGPLEGHGSPPLPAMSPDGKTRFPIRHGAPVMLGFVGGDPDRPVVLGALPQPRKAPARAGVEALGREGVIIQTSAGPAPGRRQAVRADGALPQERQLEGDGLEYATESTASEWIRFAVPMGKDKWSYVRYGEATTDTVSSGDDSFDESVLDGSFNAKHFDDVGKSLGSGETGFAFALGDLATSRSTAYGEPKVYKTAPDSPNSDADKAYFNQTNSGGVFDYTDGNRTVITQGDYQSVTAGHKTDVILGDYRVVIPKRTAGTYDADDYYMRFYNAEGSWRKVQVSHVKSLSCSYGDTENLFIGMQANGTVGTTINGMFGMNIGVTSGFNIGIGAAYNLGFDLGHTFTKSVGTTLHSSKEAYLEADDSITIRVPTIPSITDKLAQGFAIGGVATGVLALGAGAAMTEFSSIDTEAFANERDARITTFSTAGAAFLAAMIAGYYLKKSMPVTIEPAIQIDKTSIVLSVGLTRMELSATGITVSAPMLDMKAAGLAWINAPGGIMLDSKVGAFVQGGGMLNVVGDSSLFGAVIVKGTALTVT